MSGAFAYREPCQLCLASGVAQLAHRGGCDNSSLFAWGLPLAPGGQTPHLLDDDLLGVAEALGKGIDSVAVSLRYPEPDLKKTEPVSAAS
jgi:hypothetical protein